MNARLIAALTLLIPCCLTGCGKQPEAEFVLSDSSQTLMREAREGFRVEGGEGEGGEVFGVRDYLNEFFGTPQELVAWQRLPVDYGALDGVVIDSGSKPGAAALKVKLEGAEPQNFDRPGLRQWTTADAVWTVREYDAETNEVTVDVRADDPATTPEIPDVEAAVAVAPGHNLKFGRKLYMTHCMHCHGVTGDGKGPTAEYLNPPPRDYRKGLFKFTSTNDTSKATHDDLARIVKRGIPGTYMPSFMLFTDAELHAVIEYVRWLAMRGEFEGKMSDILLVDYSNTPEARQNRKDAGVDEDELTEELRNYLASAGEFEGDGLREQLDEETDFMVQAWVDAEDPANAVYPESPRVPMTAESIAKGRELYLSKKLNCRNCHGDTGEGNGPQTRDYEKMANGEPFPEPGLHDDWGNPLQPRNLTRGIYRGGRRPLDLYRRIRAGIKGAKMPAFKSNVASDEEVWHVVNYVLSIPLGETGDEMLAESGAE